MGIKNKINEKIKDKLEEVKLKGEALQTMVTNKAFDGNLLKAIQKDFHHLIDQQNDLILGEVYLFQMLEKITYALNNSKAIFESITIPEHIKKHFTIEND